MACKSREFDPPWLHHLPPTFHRFERFDGLTRRPAVGSFRVFLRARRSVWAAARPSSRLRPDIAPPCSPRAALRAGTGESWSPAGRGSAPVLRGGSVGRNACRRRRAPLGRADRTGTVGRGDAARSGARAAPSVPRRPPRPPPRRGRPGLPSVPAACRGRARNPHAGFGPDGETSRAGPPVGRRPSPPQRLKPERKRNGSAGILPAPAA